MPGDQDARAAPHGSDGPGLQQPGPHPALQRPTRLRAALMGPRGEPSPLGWVPKRGRSRALVPANVVAEFTRPCDLPGGARLPSRRSRRK